MTLPAFMDAHRPVLRGTRHMVSAGHYLAAEAALAILNAGGNAIDAGVAGGLVLGVVQSELVNIAGVAPIMIRLAGSGEVVTISGLGGWPAAADVEVFRRDYDGKIPPGLLRCNVPAAPDAWITALEKYGTISFAEAAQAAIRHARDGFIMYPMMANLLQEKQENYRRYPANEALYLPYGRPPEVGELFVQADLGRTLQYMADEEAAAAGTGRAAGLQAARDAFYKGDIAKAIADYHAQNGGWLSRQDLADFRVGIEAPVAIEFAGLRVYACGPWTQGPMLLQTLGLLEPAALAELGHNTPAYLHQLVEAVKLAAADREQYIGDPNFTDVPIAGMLSPDYTVLRRALINSDKAWPGMPPPGDPRSPAAVLETATAPEKMRETVDALDTSYLCVVDSDGNVLSATPSDTSYDGEVVPGTGLCPSSRGSQGWTEAGHASCLAPGKRGRLTPNPAIAVKAGEWVMPFGTPGGDVQIQAMAQVLLNINLFAMNVQAAVEAPRCASFSFPESFAPHPYSPGRLMLEGRMGEDVGAELAALGHKVEWWREWDWKAGAVCLIKAREGGGHLEAAADPRRACYAAGS